MKSKTASSFIVRVSGVAIVLWVLLGGVLAGASAAQPTTSSNPCPRFQAGSAVTQAQDLFSQDGVLTVNLNYYSTVDPTVPGLDPQPSPVPPPLATGLQEFCFTTPDGQEEPTLHVWPGDHLIINVTNNALSSLVFEPDQTIDFNQAPGENNAPLPALASPCFAAITTPGSTNIDFFGLNIAPKCGQNDSMHTIINSGQQFTYNVEIPEDTAPGLYWYRPQVHGIHDGIQQGGATGALIVEGIQDIQPATAGLPVQTFVVRAQPVPGNPFPLIGSEVPSWDLTVNYVTVSSCQDPQPCNANQFVGDFNPGVLQMTSGEKQFWRVVNSTAHIPLDLQLLYDGAPQPLQLVGVDGVPVNAHGDRAGDRTITQTDLIVPPAGTVEFILKGPSASVQNAVLQTLRFPTGPGGDNHPQRPLFAIQTSSNAATGAVRVPPASQSQGRRGFTDPTDAKPTKTRNLYFSEVLQDPNNPLGPTNFYLTEGTCSSVTQTCTGATPTLFSPNNPPALVTTQGSVEEWTIQNTAMEDHAFHIHNLHFRVVAVDGVALPKDQQPYLDVVLVPFWDGVSAYHNVTVRLDFRGEDVGDVLYECTFLTHADFGMRAFIQVLPRRGDE